MRYEIDGQLLTNIGDAIRTKTGKHELIIPENMPAEISSISGTGMKNIITVRGKDNYYFSSEILCDAYDSIDDATQGILSADLTNVYITSIEFPLLAVVSYQDPGSSENPFYKQKSSLKSLAFGFGGRVESGFIRTLYIGNYAFDGFTALESVRLPINARINNFAFNNVLDPSNKTIRFYFYPDRIFDTLGDVSELAFGDISGLGSDGGDNSGSGSGSGGGSATYIEGLEIYVPEDFLDAAKSSWGNGKFALNIFPYPDE